MGKLVIWGHTVADYREMFNLSDADLKGKILEFGCGPSAFNQEMHAKKGTCISCDPLFALDKATLKTKASLIFADMGESLQLEQHKFDFSHYANLTQFIQQRHEGMLRFFDDYQEGKKQKRYIPATDIHLPFDDFSFDLALSSHYLFADLDDQDAAFHLAVIKQLARVAKEVRIFPLINRNGQPSAFLGEVLLGLQEANYGVEVRSCAYHLQANGNAMLRVWAQECAV